MATFGHSESVQSSKFTYNPPNTECGAGANSLSVLESTINAIHGQRSTSKTDRVLEAPITWITVESKIMTISRPTGTVTGIVIAGTAVSQGGRPLFTGDLTTGMDISKFRTDTSVLMLSF